MQKYQTNKTLVARSIFLQGTLLNIENKQVSYYFKQISNVVKLLKELSFSYKLNYLEMLIGYVNSLEGLNHIIVSSKNKKYGNNFKKFKKKIMKILNLK